MKKIQRITESDINRIVKKSIKENKKMINESFGPEQIIQLVSVLFVLGYNGYLIFKKIQNSLKNKGENKKAEEMGKAWRNMKRADRNDLGPNFFD